MSNDSVGGTVYGQTDFRLRRLLTAAEPAVKATLADLRHGAGKVPGDDPKVWAALFMDLPEKMLGANGVPSREEWAIYTAMTLYAVHQQGRDFRTDNVNCGGISLGDAAGMLVATEGGNEDARERVARRFHQVALAQDMQSLIYYLRTFIQLLKSNGIKLDYPMLAKDLYTFQFPEGAQSIRLKWGQDFYRDRNKENDD